MCPSREIGEAIQAFHLQVDGIVIQGDLSEKGLIFSFGEEKAFLLWHVGGIEHFSLCWAHSPIVAACFLGVGCVSLPQAVCSSIVAWGCQAKGVAGRFPLMLRVPLELAVYLFLG
jgi:hypothetical protein